jgi:hypothetical protein
MAFYGDLFRDPETMSAMFPPLDASDLDDPEDAELLDPLDCDSLSWPQWDGLKWVPLCGRGCAVVTA